MAELDDLSGVAFMVLLVAIAPALRTSSNDSTLAVVTMASVIILLKVAGFLAVLYLIARYGKRPIAYVCSYVGTRLPFSLSSYFGHGVVVLVPV